MTFEPGADKTADDIEQEVPELIDNNEVVLFMKGTKHMPQCGYSKTALNTLQLYVNDITVVNVMSGSTDAYRDVLEDISGWTTIPQAFVDGEFIGGCDVIEQLHEKGDLADKLGSEPNTAPF